MRKLLYDDVKKQIESVNGYKLISTEYKNSHAKLKIKCPNNHEYKVNLANFKSGKRCPICAYKNKGRSQRLSLDYIKGRIKIIASGYKLLSVSYINAKIKLKFMCPKGHIFWMTWDNFNNGSRCSVCHRLISVKRLKDTTLTIKYIRDNVKIIAPTYKLLSTKYVNNNTKLKFICPKGHIFYMTWANFQSGQRCPLCGVESRSGINHYKWKDYTNKELQSFKYYKEFIMSESNRNFGKYYYKINKNSLIRSKYEYHLDHIYSIMEGFRNNIPPEVLYNPNNLQMMWWKDNIIKQAKSGCTKIKLYLGYYKYKLEN